MMKINQVALLSTATVLAVLASTITGSQAATVNQVIDLVNPPYAANEPLFNFSEAGVGASTNYTNTFITGEGTAPAINNNNNDTGITFSSLVYQILTPSAVFGAVTSNNIPQVTLSSDNKTATFSGFSLAAGQGFRVDRTVSDGSPVQFKFTANPSIRIPEASSVLGIFAFGAVGIGYSMKRKLNSNNWIQPTRSL
ncbi:MAG: hypothetical protein V7K32_20345 [Nostoc sp.]|uniref:hypothetical protein n=1 Tax=Nostoc sp. TaxID=1180 RepID=UPI002FF6AA88